MGKIVQSLVPVVMLSFVVLTFASARSRRVRYYLNTSLYMMSLGASSTLGVFYAVMLGLVGQRYNTSLWVARTFSKMMSTLIGYRVHMEGIENLNQRPSVIVGNHQSMLDILYLGTVMPHHSVIMSKKELQWMPFLGQFSTYTD